MPTPDLRNRPLDELDRQLIEELSQDARMTNRELADRVGLSPSGCLDRVRRLYERGVIRGTHLEVDPKAMGIGIQALVHVRLKRHTRKAVSVFRAQALELDEVVSLYHVTGEFDFVIHVVARDMAHLRDFALDTLTTRPEVGGIQTSIMFERAGRHTWPDLSEE